MEEIKVGEYFRTDTGFIDKLNQYWLFNEKYKKLNIVKHSPNIIDLIEEGDYVNGYFINYIPDNEKAVYHDASDLADVVGFREDDIKSIVTKEQFNQVKYEV